MAASSVARRSDPPSGRIYPWLFVAAMGLVILALVLLLPEGLTGWRAFGWRAAPPRPSAP